MKKNIVAAVVVLALCVAVAGPAPAFAQQKPAVKRAMFEEGRGHHPEIREAIRALERAKEHMQHAAHDFGGHRADALRACDEAIHQTGARAQVRQEVARGAHGVGGPQGRFAPFPSFFLGS